MHELNLRIISKFWSHTSPGIWPFKSCPYTLISFILRKGFLSPGTWKCLKTGEPCHKKLFTIALDSNSFTSPGYAPDPLSFIFPAPADATGTPGAGQSSVNSRKTTVVSRVVSFKGKISYCGTKLGGRRNRNLHLHFLRATLPGSRSLNFKSLSKLTCN